MSPAPTDSRARRRLTALITVGIVLLLLAAVGVYGLATGPRNTSPTDPSPEATLGVNAPPSPTLPTPSLPKVPAVPRSSDPVTFAEGVATTLFAWDTTLGLWPLDYTSTILAVGDPFGDEQAGLASDIATYLPNRDAWTELRQYATTQHLVINTSFVPDAWADALTQVQPGQIAPGTVAVTIEGTRHRTGVWNGQPVTSEHPVAFTVFVVCAPTYPTCHLLRLSQLDNPLR
ncbi:MAG: hypothetical protein IPO89_10505 [Actinomycetales bacterium]|jgi:hypothetical protein|nr:hypothetical protein [Candidatus Lutibacillus vidarii]